MRNFNNLFLILFLTAVPAYARTPAQSQACATENARLAVAATHDRDVQTYALRAMTCGEDCLEVDDKNAACYYARAIGRGRVLEENLANPADHMGGLIADFERVAALDPKWDEGGALRALAEIYLKLPKMPLWGNPAWVRDLDKAQGYAARAVAAAPENPENLKVAGEIAYARDAFRSARAYFARALKELPHADLTPSEKAVLQSALERGLKKCGMKLKKRS